MVRKYDRYGLNRQFKAKPCTKRYPFPYPLPFVDDYSLANVGDKAVTAAETVDPDTAFGGGRKVKRTRDEIKQMQNRKRASNAARKLAFEHPLGRDVYSWSRKDTEYALIAASAPFAPLAFEAVQMVGVRTAAAKARRIPKKKFIRGKVPDAIRTGLRRGRKVARFLRSQKRGPRLMRAGVRYAFKKLL